MKKIVITGPESTGKSTLSQQLATHYKTVWCPEYARQYLTTNGMQYVADDLLNIAKGQIELEEKTETETRNNLYFIDTDLYVMKIWSEVVFNNCHKWILKQIAQRSYHLYLLCNTDLPWQADALREYPDLSFRQKLFAMYKDACINSNTPFKIISGTNEQRLQMAITTVDNLF